MATNAPPSSPSFISKLPVELLKRIVELVKEQDDAFRGLDLQRATHKKETLEGLGDYDEDSEDEAEQEKAEDIAGGRWSSANGRGVRALSRQNRTLRTLTIPYLFETVTSAQLGHLYFRSHILGRPLASLIKHVDLSEGGEDQIIAVAWTLQHLPSVTSLTLSGNKEYELLNPAVQLSRTEARDPDLVAQETARLEFHNFLRQISEVRVVNIDTDTTLAILKSPRMKTSARRLKFVDGRFVESGSKGLAVALQALSLEALNIDQASSIIGLDSWAPPIQLPSLTSLTVPAYRLGEAPLPLLEKLAPNLTFLRLTASHFAMNTTSPVSFPFLTHLVLEGMTKTLVLVPLFSSCPLLTLELRSRGCKFSQAHPPSRGKWPRTLRRCHFEIFSHPRPVEVESFVSDLRADGKADSYIWRPYVDAYWPGILRHFEDKAEVVEDDLRWALAEVKVLRAAGDEEGMREFSQALTRLREKRALKMS